MRQHRERGVVAHRAEALAPTDDHGHQEHVHRLPRVAEHVEAPTGVLEVEARHLAMRCCIYTVYSRLCHHGVRDMDMDIDYVLLLAVEGGVEGGLGRGDWGYDAISM